MSIQISSTTGSLEADLRAMGGATQTAETEVEKTKSASSNKEISEQDETTEESDASEENLDGDESSEDGDDEVKEELKDGQKAKKKNGFKKRIDKLNSRASKAEQEREAALAEKEYWRNEALKSQGKKAEPEVKAKTEDSGKPKAEQFDSFEDYNDALTDWKIEQKEKAKEAKAQEEKQKSELQSRFNSHLEKVQEFKKSVADFEEVIEAVNDIVLSDTIRDAILDSKDSPELMYELSKNPEELKRINSLSPIAQAREIGRIEASISKGTEATKEPKKLTKAPPPVDPVGSGSASISKSLNDPNLSFSEYEKLRMQQLKKK